MTNEITLRVKEGYIAQLKEGEVCIARVTATIKPSSQVYHWSAESGTDIDESLPLCEEDIFADEIGVIDHGICLVNERIAKLEEAREWLETLKNELIDTRR